MMDRMYARPPLPIPKNFCPALPHSLDPRHEKSIALDAFRHGYARLPCAGMRYLTLCLTNGVLGDPA